MARKNFEDVLNELQGGRIVYLKEDGASIKNAGLDHEDVFVLGGKDDISDAEEELISKWPATLNISLGPKSLHADHCITVALNVLDNSL